MFTAPASCLQRKFASATLAIMLLLVSLVAAITPLSAQNVADLPYYDDVEPGEPLEIDGVWNVVGLGKKVLIENGHSFVLDPWVHLFVIQVERGQVVSTSIRRSDETSFIAFDNLLQRQMNWKLNSDGSISASGTGFLAPSFRMEPVELSYPEAFDELRLATVGGEEKPVPAAGGNERPGPMTQLPVSTAWLVNGFGKCLDLVDRQRTSQGGKLQTWTCKANANQEWGFYPRNRQLLSASGMCLEATGSSKGAAVKTFGCDGRPAQRWARQKLDNGMVAFVNDATGMCLDAARSTAKEDGGKIILWDCHYGKTQSWKITGKI